MLEGNGFFYTLVTCNFVQYTTFKPLFYNHHTHIFNRGGLQAQHAICLKEGRSRQSNRNSIQKLRPAAHSYRQKPPLNLMGGAGSVISAINCAMQPVSKLI